MFQTTNHESELYPSHTSFQIENTHLLYPCIIPSFEYIHYMMMYNPIYIYIHTIHLLYIYTHRSNPSFSKSLFDWGFGLGGSHTDHRFPLSKKSVNHLSDSNVEDTR